MGLGDGLDSLACIVAGHIWVQANDIDGVMTCSRCGGQAEQPAAPDAAPEDYDVAASEASDSVIPEDRPWLEPPFAG